MIISDMSMKNESDASHFQNWSYLLESNTCILQLELPQAYADIESSLGDYAVAT